MIAFLLPNSLEGTNFELLKTTIVTLASLLNLRGIGVTHPLHCAGKKAFVAGVADDQVRSLILLRCAALASRAAFAE